MTINDLKCVQLNCARSAFTISSREEIYNAAMLNKLGIGQVKLAEARKSGIAAPFKVGGD